MLGRFFRDPSQLDQIAPKLKNKIERVAAPLASAEVGDWSITPRVQQAMDLIEDARVHGNNNIDMFMKQGNLLGSQQYPAPVIALAKQFQKLPQRELVDAISRYAEDARHYGSGPSLFGGAPVSPDASLTQAFEYAKQQRALREQAAAATKATQTNGIMPPPQ